MQFKELQKADCLGWHLAHSIILNGKRLAKGSHIDETIFDTVLKSAITTVWAYKLDDTDICENKAAQLIANHITIAGFKVGIATKGRCNVFAAESGIFEANQIINQINNVSSHITVATANNNISVIKGQLVATVKIIPYGIHRDILGFIRELSAPLKLHPYQAFSATLINTGIPASKKTEQITSNRLRHVNGELSTIKTVEHSVNSVSRALHIASSSPSSLILLLGISAIADIQDVLPSAVIQAGGKIIHLGMPVDPGNLLMVAELNGKTIIGMPGCAKSPALNGFDFILQHFAANIPITRTVIQNMGIGGLLKEIQNRKAPRAPKPDKLRNAALILAAGRSSRSGSSHKLLSEIAGQSVIQQTANTIKESGYTCISAVTGYRAKEVSSELSGYPITMIHNPDYASGMGTSLKAGFADMANDYDTCLIALGDMPFVQKTTHTMLIETAQNITEASIFIPTFNGKRGNPVLWRKEHFPALQQITGDKGGRSIIHEHEHLVYEVEVNDPGILIDLDTPEALAQFGVKAEVQ